MTNNSGSPKKMQLNMAFFIKFQIPNSNSKLWDLEFNF